MGTIGIIIISAAITIVISLVITSTTEEIYYQSFWWDTSNGLNFSRAILCKVIGFYFIRYENRVHHPKKHPDYEIFLRRVKQNRI